MTREYNNIKLSFYREIEQTLKVETQPVRLLAPDTWAMRAVQRTNRRPLEPSTSVKRFSGIADRPAGRTKRSYQSPPPPKPWGGTRSRKSGCTQFTYLLAVAADGRPCHLESRRRSRPTTAAAAATDVVHRRPSSVGVPVYHTRTHTHVVTSGVRGVGGGASAAAVVTAAAPDKNDTQVIQYTGGGSRVVAHHRAYQYGTGYIGRSHARTNTHALTLSRAATAASARSRTRTHRRWGARAPTFVHAHTRARAPARTTLPDRTRTSPPAPPLHKQPPPRIFMYNAADGRGRPIAGRPGTVDGVGVSTARRGTERFPESVTFGRKRRAPRRRINLFQPPS